VPRLALLLAFALAAPLHAGELPTLGLLNIASTMPDTLSVKTTAPQTTYADLEAWPGGALPPAEFIKLVGPVAREIASRTGVPASVQIAQAALETGWGSSSIGDAHNLFGMKSVGPAGSVTKQTTEYYPGPACELAAFRAYHNWHESLEDHARLFTGQDPHLISLGKGDLYLPAMAYSHDPDNYARMIAACGYATDSSYPDELIQIMQKYGLYQWDPWPDSCTPPPPNP